MFKYFSCNNQKHLPLPASTCCFPRSASACGVSFWWSCLLYWFVSFGNSQENNKRLFSAHSAHSRRLINSLALSLFHRPTFVDEFNSALKYLFWTAEGGFLWFYTFAVSHLKAARQPTHKPSFFKLQEPNQSLWYCIFPRTRAHYGFLVA